MRDLLLGIAALAVPLIVLTLAFIPGGLGFIFDPFWGVVTCVTGAALAMIALGWRVYRRIRPVRAPKTHVAPRMRPSRMPSVEGSEAIRRYKEGRNEPMREGHPRPRA